MIQRANRYYLFAYSQRFSEQRDMRIHSREAGVLTWKSRLPAFPAVVAVTNVLLRSPVCSSSSFQTIPLFLFTLLSVCVSVQLFLSLALATPYSQGCAASSVLNAALPAALSTTAPPRQLFCFYLFFYIYLWGVISVNSMDEQSTLGPYYFYGNAMFGGRGN